MVSITVQARYIRRTMIDSTVPPSRSLLVRITAMYMALHWAGIMAQARHGKEEREERLLFLPLTGVSCSRVDTSPLLKIQYGDEGQYWPGGYVLDLRR